MKALVAGSFDPPTNGHLDLIQRAAKFADEVVVAVANNASKNYRFSFPQRVDLITEAARELSLGEKVKVFELPQGLLVDFAKVQGVDVIVKGVRNATDLAYEDPMARMNQQLSGIETVFLLANAQLQHISSSMVKELKDLDVDIKDLVPAAVVQAFNEEKN